MKKHLNIKVYGEVQAVNFRYYIRQQAAELGLAGFVRNEAEGSVYLEAEGDESLLEQLVDWCRKGPQWARVKKVEITSGQIKNLTGFKISY